MEQKPVGRRLGENNLEDFFAMVANPNCPLEKATEIAFLLWLYKNCLLV